MIVGALKMATQSTCAVVSPRSGEAPGGMGSGISGPEDNDAVLHGFTPVRCGVLAS